MVLRIEKKETSPIRKIGRYYAENGLVKAMRWIVGKSIKRIIDIRKFYILEKSLSENVPFIKAKIDVMFRMAEVQDIDYFKDILKPWDYWSGIIKKRFEKRQTCIICFHKNCVIGYVWISFVPETDKTLGLTVRPRDNESYGFDLFVLPEYRKDLIGYELISRWLQYSKAYGREKVIGVVAAWNKPMQMTTKLVFGFKLTKQLRSVEFFKRRGFIISSKII
ncbi:MAG: GNAT family N-acetyltransferase [Smithellaceae bacterium]|nr:GNAT family N-acetyltransferase [Smithellaceae bacterium]